MEKIFFPLLAPYSSLSVHSSFPLYSLYCLCNNYMEFIIQSLTTSIRRIRFLLQILQCNNYMEFIIQSLTTPTTLPQLSHHSLPRTNWTNSFQHYFKFISKLWEVMLLCFFQFHSNSKYQFITNFLFFFYISSNPSKHYQIHHSFATKSCKTQIWIQIQISS